MGQVPIVPPLNENTTKSFGVKNPSAQNSTSTRMLSTYTQRLDASGGPKNCDTKDAQEMLNKDFYYQDIGTYDINHKKGELRINFSISEPAKVA